MIGTLINSGAIVAGSCVGLVCKKGLRPRLQTAIDQASGLAVIVIGLNGTLSNMVTADPATGALSSGGELMLTFSLILGALAGEALGIEEHLNRVGGWVEQKLHLTGFAQGFISASLVYCVGAMAIIGSINDGLLGDPGVLITKAVLDGTISIVLAASLGPGVAFSALPVLVYQGALTLGAQALAPVLQGELLHQICAAGFVLVACIGVNFMSKSFHIKVANFLPALLVPAVWAALRAALGL